VHQVGFHLQSFETSLTDRQMDGPILQSVLLTSSVQA